MPPNLLGLEGAVCCHDFTSGTDGGEHLLKSDRLASFNMWRNQSAKYLVSFGHVPIDHSPVSNTDHPSDPDV
jgi:hypothetical protein